MSKRASDLRRRLPRCQRWIASAALVHYLILALGLPLPAATAGPVDAAPFPCRDHHCGCATAEKCWKSCCCFTTEQKLAWARKNGVTPPAYVIAEAESRPASTRSPAKRACCEVAAVKTQVAAKTASCCKRQSPKPTAGRMPTIATTRSVKPTVEHEHAPWVSYFAAERCRGGSAAQWLNVPISIPIASLALTSALDELVGASSIFAEPIWISATFAPPDPPPRIV